MRDDETGVQPGNRVHAGQNMDRRDQAPDQEPGRDQLLPGLSAAGIYLWVELQPGGDVLRRADRLDFEILASRIVTLALNVGFPLRLTS